MHTAVNPLAGEEHLKEVIQQLQLMGEVSMMRMINDHGTGSDNDDELVHDDDDDDDVHLDRDLAALEVVTIA